MTPTTATFYLPAPVPASHPRAQAIKGKDGKGPRVRFFHDEEDPYAVWRAAAAAIIRLNWPYPPILGPVEFVIAAVWARPENRPAWLPADAWKTGRRVFRPTRPDLENVIEAVQDVVQLPARQEGLVHIRKLPNDQVRGYPLRDDGQVCRVLAEDWLGAIGETARTVVAIRQINWFGE